MTAIFREESLTEEAVLKIIDDESLSIKFTGIDDNEIDPVNAAKKILKFQCETPVPLSEKVRTAFDKAVEQVTGGQVY